MKQDKVRIEIYDEDGDMRESVGGRMDWDEIREIMLEALKNDSLPVLIKEGQEKKGAMNTTRMGNEDKREDAWAWEQPMTVHIEYDGLKFSATGRFDDVMEAQEEFLGRIIEE